MRLKIFLRRTLLIFAGFVISPALLVCFNLQSWQSVSALASSLAPTIFTDVAHTHPNYAAINYVQTQNIVSGYPDGAFRPDQLINRAEFIKIILEAYFKEQTNGSNCFSDVGTEWFAKYICFGKMRNFIAGYPDGSFQPASKINFVEAAKVLAEIRGLTVIPDPDFWYKPYVEKLTEVRVIPTSIMSFDQQVTRGEAVEMVYRLKANVTNKPAKTYTELLQEQANIGLPVRLKIPGIKVDAAIEYVGLTQDGAVDVPKNSADAAWFNLGPRPGDSGSAVITGHINWYDGVTGVFSNLHKVKPGDQIVVQDIKGAVIFFTVREIRIYAAAADATNVFSSSDGKSHLNLITCEGVWDKRAQQYTQRLVIFTDRE